jgi:hypothetical protein
MVSRSGKNFRKEKQPSRTATEVLHQARLLEDRYDRAIFEMHPDVYLREIVLERLEHREPTLRWTVVELTTVLERYIRADRPAYFQLRDFVGWLKHAGKRPKRRAPEGQKKLDLGLPMPMGETEPDEEPADDTPRGREIQLADAITAMLKRLWLEWSESGPYPLPVERKPVPQGQGKLL